ncbi:MAG: EAL domain-containing protein [Burkholderiaceae bacterium]|nr:EAL domain-containing protein [Burkholderiaceae bacterium]
MFQKLDIGIVVHAPDSRILFSNDRASQLLGLSREQLLGKEAIDPAWCFVDEDEMSMSPVQYPIARTLATYEPLKSLVMGIRWKAQAQPVWVLVNGFPEFDTSGALQHVVVNFVDISDHKKAEFLLRKTQALSGTVLDALSAQIALLDPQGYIVGVNEAWRRSGRANGGLPCTQSSIGVNYLDVCISNKGGIDPSSKRAADGLRSVLSGESSSFELEYPCHSYEEQRWFQMHVTPLMTEFGGAVVSHENITERKMAQPKLELAANVFNHSREAIMVVDADGAIVDINTAFTRITGYSLEEVKGKNPRLLRSGKQDADFYADMWRALTEQGHWSGEIWNRRKDGEVYAELLTISSVRDAQGKTQQYVALFSDITSIKSHQSQLERMAHYDALTGLPNRLLLSDRLKQALTQAQRRDKKVAVAYLDLDGFKTVNDRYGHNAGDRLLIAMANAMKNVLREGDTLARIGGDEFVVVLIDLNDTESCVPMLTRLLEAAAAPMQLDGIAVQSAASLGVSFYPQAEDIDADQLMRQADQAMYQAKVAGKNRYRIFDAAQDNNARVHHESLARIRLALAQREFVLYYQPQVNMRSGKVIGVEALIRWQHPEKGLLAPGVFLPVIEDDPLAVEVGEWVIETALAQIELWHSAAFELAVSVNIGARQLQQSNFVERLQSILARHPQVNPSKLELEVLETSALEDIAQVSQVIAECRRMGIKFALDDFGTGYSSLNYLKRLRVSLLKIDQSFVRDMLDDPDDLAILEAIIGLASAFRREVIAEGVETVAHGTALLNLGCHMAQGYGIARPMPAEQLPDWAATWKPDAAWCELHPVR